MKSFGVLILLSITIYFIVIYKKNKIYNTGKKIELRYIPYGVFDQFKPINLSNFYDSFLVKPIERNDLSPWKISR